MRTLNLNLVLILYFRIQPNIFTLNGIASENVSQGQKDI